MDLSRVWVVIPAYNEEKTLGEVIADLKNNNFENILVIDDGSSDKTRDTALQQNVVVVPHPVNCGLGASLATGLKYLVKLENEISGVITFDADAQHRAKDALKVITLILEDKADFVVGSRLLIYNKAMPLVRKLGNSFVNTLVFLFYGIKTTDSQSGLRALSPRALRLISLRTIGYNVSSEFFKEVSRNHLRYAEVPIESIYTQDSLNKGQNFTEALRTIRSFLMES